ncbi:unnamed protein product [Rangifer tarandus platyrhynchus]|uniref:Uncharacterized protein n=1 Tax=Rangifer tarandus platyrhynchus TaxID=3082113 RepID=A0ABN8Y8F7_RANTA|nr:unnamed protein product [Rangifer tarandus platyrhynchus]
MPCPAALGRTCTPAGRYTGRHPCKPVPASTCLARICTHAPPELRSPLARGPAHVCTQAGRSTGPHGPTSKNWREGRGRGRPGSRVRAANASGRSRQPGLRPEGQAPAAPSSARAVHVSRAPREARGLGLSSSSPAPRRIRHPASRALPGPRRLEIQGKSGQRRDPCPQPARRRPPSASSRSHATSAQAQLAPSRDQPVGAPWGSATRPFPTRRPQTRPKFPRPPSGRAPTCRTPGFPLLLPGTAAASSSAAEDARPGPAGPCAGSRGSCAEPVERDAYQAFVG